MRIEHKPPDYRDGKKSIGMYKNRRGERRFLDINPDAEINTFNVFYTPETAHLFDFSKYDYIVDAIDTVTGKIELIVNADKANTPIISSMGAGNKINPDMFEVSDIYKTEICPLARVMRRELKKTKNQKSQSCLFKRNTLNSDFWKSRRPKRVSAKSKRRQTPGSTAFSPSVAGLIIAGEIIKDLTHTKKRMT
ncbi:MAG: ThiF family adenylyltransferase [Clostridiales bacterium]|nr:MAG: ThiF family adenylyltransferase [Clostridiales bacterium]